MTAYSVGGAMLGGAMPGVAPRPFEANFGTGQPGITTAERPVTDEVLRQQAAARLQHIYRWIEATAPVAPQALDVVPMLITAVQLYEAQQYGASLSQVQTAIDLLQQARWAVPMLPPL